MIISVHSTRWFVQWRHNAFDHHALDVCSLIPLSITVYRLSRILVLPYCRLYDEILFVSIIFGSVQIQATSTISCNFVSGYRKIKATKKYTHLLCVTTFNHTTSNKIGRQIQTKPQYIKNFLIFVIDHLLKNASVKVSIRTEIVL